jgi:indole-3-glycerol phosphate synthase
MNILEKIVEQKKLEVKNRKEKVSVNELEQSECFNRKTFSLKQFLLDEDRTGIIAEFKRKSPSKGIINANASVASVTASYAKFASGISVLTDENFFGGSIADLQQARFNKIPILRKDFMIDEYQIIEAKSIGADVVLLIAACLTPQQVKQLASAAKKLQLEVLLEIHHEEELNHICNEVDFVGVNNRNLKTFEVNIQTSLRLIHQIPKNKLAITESGISSIDAIKQLRSAGFKGFLMGENFMKEENPALAFENFVTKLKA